MLANAGEAVVVIEALKEYERRLNEIMDLIGDKKSITPSEKEWLQQLITPLKGDIKAANKRGKVHDDRAPQTAIERAFFEPAMRGASANFMVATNSHPIRSGWFSCLYNVNIDITHFLYNLEKYSAEQK